jgi:hypothetical protein
MRTSARTQLATVAAVLITLAGCGGNNANDDNDAAGAPATSQPEQPVPDFDLDRLCSMLELSEIEAEFGEYGAIHEGELNRDWRSCDWQIGEQVGEQLLQLRVVPTVANPRERLDREREGLEQDEEYEVVDVSGVGEYAYSILWQGSTQLVFLSQGYVFYLYTLVDATEELTTLAGYVVDRI